MADDPNLELSPTPDDSYYDSDVEGEVDASFLAAPEPGDPNYDEYITQIELEEQAAELAQIDNLEPIGYVSDSQYLGTGYQPTSVNDTRKRLMPTDWRFRVRLAPGTDYLYNAPNPGILAPLREYGGTDGVIFPYTPQITMRADANYQQYDLTHSNFRGYFYSNSRPGDIIVNSATFTAQDTNEANYMLAVIHFFRSATKMFYGRDQRRGTPPPLLYLNGLGEYQFNEHPCLLTMFTYTLPDNVDYIKTSNTPSATYQPQGKNSAASRNTNQSRLANLLADAIVDFFTDPLDSLGFGDLIQVSNGATYVPTKINLQLNFVPVTTRQQMSNEYSLKEFANGSLLKKGYW